MALNENLVAFVEKALGTGLSRQQINSELEAAGWPKKRVKVALAAFADSTCTIPVPKPTPYLSAAEAFYYLLTFMALYVSAYYLVDLLFNIIDWWLPEQAEMRVPGHLERLAGQIRLAISVLVIFFPLYLLLTARDIREIQKDPSKRSSSIRKWLAYLTLFVAAITILSDISTLLYRFLSGDMTLRILIKIVVIGTVSGVVFAWYMSDLRQDEAEEVN